MNHCIKVCLGCGSKHGAAVIKTRSPANQQEFLDSSASTQIAAQLFSNYSRNVSYNLEAVGKMPKPV